MWRSVFVSGADSRVVTPIIFSSDDYIDISSLSHSLSSKQLCLSAPATRRSSSRFRGRCCWGGRRCGGGMPAVGLAAASRGI
ncbi:hypothetical protein L484_020733 [Morus notabilis]|uniref:Uncharacterized protein n=1 Tax=Morus notabilis TaxID=981085 RepID=W9QWW8_9ROSA|nr:hypothetical protein L484_020733 [Morus notabilis]